MIKVYSLGAAKEVTGSKHVLEFNGEKILIDCGAFQGKDSYDKNKETTIPNGLKAVYLTHAHFDHCGQLPLLLKNNEDVKIYSTQATADLANIVMTDGAKIQAVEATTKKQEPLYTEADVAKIMENFSPLIKYNSKYDGKTYKCSFYDAGHILGSSMIEFEINNKILWKTKKEPTRILYTGDLGRKNTPITKDPETNIEAPNYIFMESTYGDRLHAATNTIFEDLAKVINETINEKKGKVIIPAFAIERTQEVIYYLKILMNKKKIPSVPIYIDSPMACNATSVFQIHTECYNEEMTKKFVNKGKNPFSMKSLHFISSKEESLKIAKSNDPCIIISASGMCEAGRVLTHLKYGLINEKNTILVVGYMSEGGIGRYIADGNKKVKIEGKEYSVRAKVERIDAFSSHADYEEMLEWLKAIDTSKLKKIFLIHGNEEAQKHFKKFLKENGFKHIKIVEANKKYFLL